MNAETNTVDPPFDYAELLIEDVRDHYRRGHASYAGNRSEDQRVIAELASEEARLLVDGVAMGYLAVNPELRGASAIPDDYEDLSTGGHAWHQFRGEFERLLAGFGVISNRLHSAGYQTRDGRVVPNYLELDDSSRSAVAMKLFSDFLAHNGLRFGVDGSGLKASHYRHTPDGGMERVIRDKDKAMTDKVLSRNMSKRGYASGIATHPAGKISVKRYKHLRQEYPDLDKDTFDQEIGASRDVASDLAVRGR